jgi:hypothetical protein
MNAARSVTASGVLPAQKENDIRHFMENISVRLPGDVKEFLGEYADKEDRSISNLARIIITRWVKTQKSKKTPRKKRKKP